jgi:hypothetical protein
VGTIEGKAESNPSERTCFTGYREHFKYRGCPNAILNDTDNHNTPLPFVNTVDLKRRTEKVYGLVKNQ